MGRLRTLMSVQVTVGFGRAGVIPYRVVTLPDWLIAAHRGILDHRQRR